ncbi:MAG: serine/threonine-protein kinase, partial [Thermoanaerobaculia bacterium]
PKSISRYRWPRRALPARIQPPAAPAPQTSDDHFDGFSIKRQLAAGGLCEIFLVSGDVSRRGIAMKVLLPAFRDARSAIENLVNEARILKLLNERHPDEIFIRVFEQSWFEDADARHPYILMEYVEGQNLKEIVQSDGALPEAEVFDLVRSTASALAAVHAEGLAHGDISPENILRISPGILSPRRGQRYRLIDFGDARDLSLPGRTDEIVGKPHFISPEQCEGFIAGAPSDVYSLGMVFYYLSFGRPAFERVNTLEVLGMHRATEVSFPESAPEDVRWVIQRLVSKDPSDRPTAASAVDLMDQLASRRT